MKETEQTSKIETEALTLAQEAYQVQISDQESYDAALDWMQRSHGFLRRWDAIFDPVIQSTHQAHKKALAQKNLIAKPVIQGQLIVKQRKVEFDLKQQRLQEEEQRRREAEANRQREEELLKKALHAESQGMPGGMIDAILAEPDIAPPPAAPPMHRVDKRVYTRDVWKAEVTDMKALIAAAASGKASPTLLMANQTAINALAKSLRDTMNIPGLRAYCDKMPAGRF